MDETMEKDIKRNQASLTALYYQMGQRIDDFIRSIAESIAYRQATVRELEESIATYAKEERRRTREGNRTERSED